MGFIVDLLWSGWLHAVLQTQGCYTHIKGSPRHRTARSAYYSFQGNKMNLFDLILMPFSKAPVPEPQSHVWDPETVTMQQPTAPEAPSTKASVWYIHEQHSRL
ncbi:hypothetical protein ASPTUDRAFT_43617 [Aspergillus tubingensis CBS 134.48]|uniref:Uncharacterized protein n=1 Tax=Aspergillus tubingensis (strain CBS 134.48) TaxID=767770 RepID=A0A1L9N5V1_ASPTC|nr:hypothetical protein ASPTUDRAFT_43617 [Aspergillus tubingensis CBS 134.48]